MTAKTPRDDKHVERIRAILEGRFGSEHPKAKVNVYRYNSASIRIRIIDRAFAGKIIPQREEMVWPILEALPQATLSEITVLLLISPRERKRSFMSMEFDNPIPSKL